MTERHRVHTDRAPTPVAPYSQAMTGAGLIFTAGTVGIDTATGHLTEGGAAEQAERVIANLAAVLEEAGSGLDRIVRATIYLTDIADYAAVNEVYGRLLPEPYPARTTIAVRALPLGALVEIECVALAAS